MEKAAQALAAAQRDLAANDPGLATNRVYYACFYAVTAALLRRGQVHVKHSSVRVAVHQHLVRTGVISEQWGRFYDRCLTERHEADYNALARFDAGDVREMISQARTFVTMMNELPAD